MALHGTVLVPLVLLVGLCGCGQAPTRPTYVSRDPSTGLLPPVCTPVQQEVHCTEMMWTRDRGTIDVTASATWSVADSSLSDGLTASSIAAVSSPGIIAPVRQGNISIHVRYLTDHAVAPHTYAIDPTASAIPLAPDLTGFVSEVDGTTPIAGVLIEIIDGAYNSGKTATTLANGYYFIEHLRMASPLTVRASKSGYSTSVGTHPGIVDDASGFPEPNYLHFRLTRMSAN
jgi:hypothetical protein